MERPPIRHAARHTTSFCLCLSSVAHFSSRPAGNTTPHNYLTPHTRLLRFTVNEEESESAGLIKPVSVKVFNIKSRKAEESIGKLMNELNDQGIDRQVAQRALNAMVRQGDFQEVAMGKKVKRLR